MKSRIALFLAALICGYCGRCHAHGMSLPELQELAGPFGVTVSGAADGSTLAVGWKGEVLLVDVRARRVIQNLGPGFGPKWAPNSPELAFYSKRSGTLQLWLWRRGGGGPRQLTHDTDGVDVDPTFRVAGPVLDAFAISWSPDGSHLAFASRLPTSNRGIAHSPDASRTRASPMAPIVLTNSTALALTLTGVLTHPGFGYGGVYYSDDGITMLTRDGENSETQVRVVDVESGAAQWMTGGDHSHFDPAWSPDGEDIACVSVAGAGLAMETSETQIELIDQRSRAIRQVRVASGVKSSLLWMAPGERLAFMQRAKTFFGWPKVFAVDIGRREAPDAIAVLNDLDRRIAKLLWSPSANAFLVSYGNGVSSALARVGVDSPAQVLTRAPYPISIFEVATFGAGAVAWVQSDPRDLWTLRYLKAGAREPITLLHFSRLPKTGELGRAEVVRWRNASGEEIEGSVLLPPHFDASRRHALIVDAYPHEGGSDWTSPMGGNYAWAAAGYVVFRPAPPAPIIPLNSRITESLNATASGPAGWAVTVDDVMSGVDHLVAMGLVDPNRMCLYGWSNGGGVVDYLVTKVHRFRCAVSVAPAFADVVRLFLLSPQELVSWLDGGRQLDEGVGDYIALSSVFHLSSVQTPMLLADGDEDGDCLLNSIEVYDRLRQLGKPVTLVRYPGQAHVLSGDALSDFWSREMRFFAEYLGTR